MPDEALKLDTLQREVLRPQIAAFIDAAQDAAARESYAALLAAVEALEVPGAMQAQFGAIVEVALTSGRVRRLFGPAAELSLNSLFSKTPRGRAISESVAALNRALAQLNGQSIAQLSAALKSPGVYSLTIVTDQCQLVIRFEAGGVRLESVDVGLA